MDCDWRKAFSMVDFMMKEVAKRNAREETIDIIMDYIIFCCEYRWSINEQGEPMSVMLLLLLLDPAKGFLLMIVGILACFNARVSPP